MNAKKAMMDMFKAVEMLFLTEFPHTISRLAYARRITDVMSEITDYEMQIDVFNTRVEDYKRFNEVANAVADKISIGPHTYDIDILAIHHFEDDTREYYPEIAKLLEKQ